jgi:hypothetical protein
MPVGDLARVDAAQAEEGMLVSSCRARQPTA